MNKQGKSNNLWVILAVIAVGAYFLIPAVNDGVNGLFEKKAPTAPTTPSGQGENICIYDGSTMTLGPVAKKYDPSTSISGIIHDRLFVNGLDLGIKADGTTQSVTPGDNIEIVYAENSTLYYAADQSFVAPCAKTFSTGDSNVDKDGKHLVVLQGTSSTVAMTMFNYATGLTNSLAANETVVASTTVTPKLRISFPAKAGVSPYGKVYLVMKFNTSSWDSASFTVSSSDVKLSPDVTPTVAANELSAAGYSTKTWSFSGVQGDSTLIASVYPSLTSHSSNAATSVTFYLYDEDFFQNSVTGKMGFGANTNLDADVGITTEPSVTYNVVSS